MGALDHYVRTPKEELLYAEETVIARLAVKFASLMQKSNMSEENVIKLAQITPKELKSVLLAEDNISIRTIARIAKVLKCDIVLKTNKEK